MKYYFFNGQPVAMLRGSNLYDLHSDHLGSTVLETYSSNAAVAASQQYCAYGKKRSGTSCTSGNALSTDKHFTGQKYDSTGLHYYNARYYDDHLGQFVSPDTLVPDVGNVFDYNRFMYTRGNPLKYTDPTGHRPQLPCIGCNQEWYDYSGTSRLVNKTVDGLATVGCWFARCTVDRQNDTISGLSEQEYAEAVSGDLIGMGIAPIGMVNVPGAKVAEGFAGASQAAENVATGFRNFTRRNFRENLSRLTGIRPDKSFEAHHVLPQALEKDFTEIGINIHDPQFGSWVDAKAHRQWSYTYNQRWTDFLDPSKDLTQQQIFDFAKQLAEEYKFNVNFSH